MFTHALIPRIGSCIAGCCRSPPPPHLGARGRSRRLGRRNRPARAGLAGRTPCERPRGRNRAAADREAAPARPNPLASDTGCRAGLRFAVMAAVILPLMPRSTDLVACRCPPAAALAARESAFGDTGPFASSFVLGPTGVDALMASIALRAGLNSLPPLRSGHCSRNRREHRAEVWDCGRARRAGVSTEGLYRARCHAARAVGFGVLAFASGTPSGSRSMVSRERRIRRSPAPVAGVRRNRRAAARPLHAHERS
jgi:hypothetical protein